MPPEHLINNMWRLFEGEFVTGEGGTIEGPKMVRVHELEGGKLMIQAGNEKITVEVTDFEAAVQKR